MTAVTHAQLSKVLLARLDDLSPQLKKVAGYLIEYPGDVALLSMREVARRAGVQPASVLRLAVTLGFDRYVALREVFRNRLRQSQTAFPFSGRARELQKSTQTNEASELLGQVMSAEIQNITETFSANSEKTIERVVKSIEGATHVFILGQRSCFPAAFLFNYVYRLFRPNSVLLDSHGGAVVDALRNISSDDVLVAISIEPYTAEVVRAAQFARNEGARVVAITDSRVSPIRKSATEMLITVNRSPSFFHSILSVMALVHGLIAILVARGGNKTLKAIAKSEKQLEWFHAYWSAKKLQSS